MTAPSRPASTIAPTRGEYAVIRCLYGRQPERRARDIVVSVFAWLGLKDEAFEAELAVDELVANAREHARPPYELRIYISADTIKIAVMDGGADHAALAHRLYAVTAGEPTEGESGRGLQLVAGLFSGRCGVEPTTSCIGLTPAKQVWIALPRTR